MNLQFIKSPSPGTKAILTRRLASGLDLTKEVGAVGLVQGKLAEMLTAADIAEKAAQVRVEEIRGVCPQHVTLIAIMGDIAAVEAALQSVANYFGLSNWQGGSVIKW